MLEAADRRSLALLYHLNSEPWLDYEPETFELPSDGETPAAGGGKSISLPVVAAGGAMGDLIRRRASCRAYADRPLALETLAGLLAGTYGVARTVRGPDGFEIAARSVPSAGALYPLDVYLQLRAVESLDDGLYRYDPLGHEVELLRAGTARDGLARSFLAPEAVESPNVVVLMSAVFNRTVQKYGARGYRYILIEAGHAAQNLCLLAAEQGLATLCLGGYMDAALNRFLGLDMRREGVVYCVVAGHPA